MSNDVLGLLLSKFDIHKGQTLIWSRFREGLEGLDIAKDIELRALPSGIHEIAEDIIHFSSLKDTDTYGVACFQSNGLELAAESYQIDRSRVKMYSLSIIVRGSSKEIMEKPYPSLIQGMLRKWINLDDEDDFTLLVQYSERLLNLGEIGHLEYKPRNPPMIYLPYWLGKLGPLIFTLWKQVLMRHRILVVNYPGHPYENCNALLWLLSRMTSEFTNTEILYTVNVIDCDTLRSRKSYIATTGDEILISRNDIYDCILHADANGKGQIEGNWKITDSSGNDLKATPNEWNIFKELNTRLTHDERTLEIHNEYSVEKKPWTQLLIDLFYYATTAGYIVAPFHQKILELNRRLIDIANLSLKKPRSDLDYDDADFAKRFVKYFETKTQFTYNQLKSLVESQELLADSPSTAIDSSFIADIDLDVFSEQDYMFIERMSHIWFSKDIEINSSRGLALFC